MKRWELLVFHLMKDHKKVPSPQIVIKIKNKGKGDRTSFWSQHESLNDEHHQHEGQPHGGKWKKFKGRGSHGGHGESQ